MENEKKSINSIDEYIAASSQDVQEKMNALRALIHEEVPDVTEKISWGMATFGLFGNLVHFAGHKQHIGFYPGPSCIENFAAELSGYKTSKGAVQFPNSAPLPLDMIRRMVRFSAESNRAAERLKAEKKKKLSVEKA